ncbi:hypothetical protein PF001_g26791 [Phytophthora fragariae]|uniref:Secreted protein n=1 Tax=Phytophthora fragariae TaxID=53985 RepID=A0A6A4BLL2_9STRA|nr:hypothetical protein PF003_g35434 [Phytophthora fragariae]KAE8921772.1 hypothetical protein PF009_g27954 [Phytophthora fragariae]KAE9275016.1 hypothetical protein PF001_g26791 [Phytophthora fragariae]
MWYCVCVLCIVSSCTWLRGEGHSVCWTVFCASRARMLLNLMRKRLRAEGAGMLRNRARASCSLISCCSDAMLDVTNLCSRSSNG